MKRLTLPGASVLLTLHSFFGAAFIDADEPLVTIDVRPGEWGSSPLDETQAVCDSVAREFLGQFGDRRWDPIELYYFDAVPITAHDLIGGKRVIRVGAKDRHWAQLAFQFSHECCHVTCNLRAGDQSNLWFEESLCEAASLFTLRRMASTWRTSPPRDYWKGFADSLASYANDRIEGAEKLGDRTLADWYRQHEAVLRSNPIDREKNNVVAVALLPLLERDPLNWRAVSYLNLKEKRAIPFADYLREWHAAAPERERVFIVEVAGLFEVDVE